jgi:polyisoprenoid-binding protein YceI
MAFQGNMHKRNRDAFRFLSAVLVFLAGMPFSYAHETMSFGPKEAKIEGSIKYSLIGKYIANFKRFQGKVTLDGPWPESVCLYIDAASIKSNCPWCDKIVRSRRLLNTAHYPQVVFKSDKIIRAAEGYNVKGTLEMHGIKRPMIFPFKVQTIIDPRTKTRLLAMEGKWRINRKEFNIVWNKLLDHGGVLVSDEFIVDWKLKIKI